MSPYSFGIHAPVLVNAICHGVGALVFGLLCLFFTIDHQRTRASHHLLPAIASGLAFLWNIGSVIVLSRGAVPDPGTDMIAAISFSVLTVLPAVLLNIAVGRRQRWVVLSGYALSFVSVVLHCLDGVTGRQEYHRAAILLMTVGFPALTLVSLGLSMRGGISRGNSGLLATSMCLFFLAVSFLHLGSGQARHAWSSEIIFHHAGIPLALFVLLQDHRFLMLDTFVRVLGSVGLSAGVVYGAIALERTTGILEYVKGRPVLQGLLILGACLLLALFAVVRNGVQRWMTRVVFGRRPVEPALRKIRRLRADCSNEETYVREAAEEIAHFSEAVRFEIVVSVPPEWSNASAPFAPSDFRVWRSPDALRWVYAVVPVSLRSERIQYLLLGARRGNRRYLSEDFKILARMSAAIADELSRYQALEMQALVSEAELRALQAQINPHFLFNALNTLYGTIQRENDEARRMVLNLAEVLRHALGSDRRYSSLADELRIVKAYLEIERLRLGAKLITEIEVDADALPAQVPVLSIQPLVENAIKHGVARTVHNGYVRLVARREGTGLQIEIANSGELKPEPHAGSGTGVGLKNVRRRLALCYGAGSELSLSSAGKETIARFTIPFRTV